MTANDMELGIETEIHGIIEDNGRIAIDAKIFSEIVRRLPDNDISIETDGTDSVPPLIILLTSLSVFPGTTTLIES